MNYGNRIDDNRRRTDRRCDFFELIRCMIHAERTNVDSSTPCIYDDNPLSTLMTGSSSEINHETSCRPPTNLDRLGRIVRPDAVMKASLAFSHEMDTRMARWVVWNKSA